MASDILLYDATHVPVGDDQKQHLELCRDIAQKFNNEYKCSDFLRPPEPLIQKHFSRIMSLKDGTKKMSKSDIAEGSRINLTDTEDQIVNKIKKYLKRYSLKDVVKLVSEKNNLSKKKVYNICLSIKKK